jgi:DNA end-binding protein Ku
VKVSFSGRENIVAIRAAGDDERGGMMAYTLRYAAELKGESEFCRDLQNVEVDGESLELAELLITKRSAKLDLSKFEDGYELAVREHVDAKVKHLPIPHDEGVLPARGNVVNLMDALKKSLGSDSGKPTKLPAKKPVSSVKATQKKGIGLVKAASTASSKRRSA